MIFRVFFIVATALGAVNASLWAFNPGSARAETITIGIGTQDATINTVSAGAIIRELKLLEKHLPRTGRYADVTYRLDWQNFTSGPPITNGMMAGKLQFGIMGDYPLLINGETFQNNRDSRSRLISVAAYNLRGSGNAVLVHADSGYEQITDLKGKTVSVPFGSAAHGMLLKLVRANDWPADYFTLLNQSPEVGTVNLRERKIDAHADFVPYGELLPFRGFARKIFDGTEIDQPTWHGVVVRSDFAGKHPDIVTAYLKAQIEAGDWIRDDPRRAAERIEAWTGIEKEVVYMFLGPGGLMTTDPTLKDPLIEAAGQDAEILRDLGRIGAFDVRAFADDSHLRRAFADLGLNYEDRRSSFETAELRGIDPVCRTPITAPRDGGEIWIRGGDITAYSSARCTFAALDALDRQGVDVAVVYLFDKARGLKLFAEKAWYVLPDVGGDILPFLLKGDAADHAARIGGRVGDFSEARTAARSRD